MQKPVSDRSRNAGELQQKVKKKEKTEMQRQYDNAGKVW